MRYRRFSYRYALLVSANMSQLVGERLQAQLRGVQLAPGWWRPAADVYETPDAITLTVELAGIDHEELDVVLYEDAIVLEGQRRLPAGEPGRVYHTAEIRQGPFRLEQPLPAAIDQERVSARYDRGLLLMTLPKRKET
jgi:HSP20 family protein